MPSDPVQTARRWSEELEESDPYDRIRWAASRFGAKLAIATSFGRDSVVVLDIARTLAPQVPVLFLETGYHFPETLDFGKDLQTAWGLNVVTIRPDLTVAEQDDRFGPDLWARDPDACCGMRKVAPLQKALAQYSAWVTGIRRDQHAGRATTPVVEWQELNETHGVYKVNPLATWSRSDVDAYIQQHGLPSHPLAAKGFSSIGCSPCTAPVSEGAPERAGRWVGRGKLECGIHFIGARRSAAADGG